METYLYTLDDDLFDFYDSVDYSDDLGSTCSNESDQENHQNHQYHIGKKSGRTHGGKKTQQRKAANLRERRRMKSINDAFDTLRQCIPTNDAINDRKLSKVDTLKLAMKYITYLSDMIQATDEYAQNSPFSNNERQQEKVIVRCHFSETDPNGPEPCLLGHSLSWTNEKTQQKSPDNKLFAKIWIPQYATDQDLANLATYAIDYSNHPE